MKGKNDNLLFLGGRGRRNRRWIGRLSKVKKSFKGLQIKDIRSICLPLQFTEMLSDIY